METIEIKNSLAKFSDDREWAFKHPSEGRRVFCGKAWTEYGKQTTTCLTYTGKRDIWSIQTKEIRGKSTGKVIRKDNVYYPLNQKTYAGATC